jgi:GH15 family glucan-1,4-alpha-glucosidase
MAATSEGEAYPPISDYGAIGNLRTVALVGRNGSIDWWCAPGLSDPSVFAALLDRQRGGRFAVAPADARDSTQRYIAETNVLETCIETDSGRLVITDWMPLHGDMNGQGRSTQTAPEICRLLRADGEMTVELEWSPRFDYARSEPRIHRTDTGLLAEDGTRRLVLAGLPADAELRMDADSGGPVARARFRLAGPLPLVCRWDDDTADASAAATDTSLQRTVDAWHGWIRKDAVADRGWASPWEDLVLRSELVLKLLLHADTGALAAAPTTSLPETPGGIRNWDYRYSWIRDAALIGQAFTGVGHDREMRAFLEWAERVSQHADGGRNIQIVFGLHGEPHLPEQELPHLEGYGGAAPVRIGNGGTEQHQHDVFSDLLCSAYELDSRESLPAEIWRFLSHVTDIALERWQEPDYGIWEMRTGPHQFVFSKVKVWEALTRAIWFAEHGRLPHDTNLLKRVRRQIRDDVLEHGYDAGLGAFVMAYDRRELDAANLQIPLMEFLPPGDPRVQSTIDRTLEGLTENGLVYRYTADDGLAGDEGTFNLCTFWLVDALALSGRLDEAYAIFDGIAGRASHLGLFSEQIDARTGAFLGNFPQAFSHVGLINSVLYLAWAEQRELPVDTLIGTPEHRRRLGLD